MLGQDLRNCKLHRRHKGNTERTKCLVDEALQCRLVLRVQRSRLRHQSLDVRRLCGVKVEIDNVHRGCSAKFPISDRAYHVGASRITRTLRQLNSDTNQQREDEVDLCVNIVAQRAQALNEGVALALRLAEDSAEDVHDRELSQTGVVSISVGANGKQGTYARATTDMPADDPGQLLNRL